MSISTCFANPFELALLHIFSSSSSLLFSSYFLFPSYFPPISHFLTASFVLASLPTYKLLHLFKMRFYYSQQT